MSARSAYARKKTTQAKSKDPVKHGRAQSIAATSSSGESIYVDTSYPPTSPFTSSPRYPPPIPQYATMPMGNRGEWQGRGNPMTAPDWNRDAYLSNQLTSPTEDWVHGRTRRATMPEEYSTIEKSGLRSMIDKRSDDVRKTIAKTFTFRKKEKDEEPLDEDDEPSRPSADTVQPRIIPSPGLSPTESRGWHIKSTAPTESRLPSVSSSTPSQYLLSPSPRSQVSCNIPLAGPPPTSKLPPIPQATPASAPQMKRWCGGGKPITKWNKMRKDPELWDPNGDVLIYLGRNGQSLPTMRISSYIIEATNSRYLTSLLNQGSLEGQANPPPSPRGEYYEAKLGQDLRDGLLTPPTSGRTSIGDVGGQVLYKMHFPPPQNAKTIDQLRHQITTRNFFALLLNASLVGLSLHEALSDLHVRLDSYMPPNNDNVSQIVRYIYNRDLDDVRNSPSVAVSLLMWAEEPDVRWEEGWRECFTHSVGMYDAVQKCKDFKRISSSTRQLMDRASKEISDRVQAAEDRLAGFRFQDIYIFTPETVSEMRAIGRLKDMLLQHFEREYGSWPPASAQQDNRSVNTAENDSWLTRTLVMKLQKDFGALYDGLVDRDIIWGVLELRSRNMVALVSKQTNRPITSDTDYLPIADMMIEFDKKYRFPHIPHPYPLLPESTSSSRRNDAKKRADHINALEKRIRLAYTESYNESEIDSGFVTNSLVQAFERFEKMDDIENMSPATARRSRWILIYGILQSLASVSVDDGRVQYSDKVEYHLSPRLEGVKLPPWKRGPSENIGEGAHERSYCWTEETEKKDDNDDDDEVDLSLINDLDLPIQMNTEGAVGGRSTGPGMSGSISTDTDTDMNRSFRPGFKERRNRRDRENESPVVTDYLYT
ncbi:hypothetical protein FVEN_g1913 [Fusarium venenatum]|uniref:DUF8004 domain-containing protein n=1 Tax=Fusarium venenatum TaxID=56646 RepID=A0A2L2SP99_9HYPO|nr:uncharacterized protein FVRRES_12317 [Fusarium venenatum]KAG8360142.1 hypothetical protein FVEN_g1913 [Fusarium venenatum]CEI39626.1 unnamed protein product [Fusarium venenatum]